MSSQKGKHILLVTLPSDGEVRDQVTHKFYKNKVVKYMPLGVLSVAANLTDHHVTVLDASSRGLSIQQTIDEINAQAPEILGISAVTYRAWAMTQILTNTHATKKVVGGPHVLGNERTILKQGADAVFVGDAESTFPNWIKQGMPDGMFVGEPVDFDTVPLPRRDLLNLDDYAITPNKDLLFNVGRLRMPMVSSKGCPFRCTYCDVQQKQFNWKSPERVVEEFQALIEMGATSIHIIDDCFNVRKDRVIKICNLLIQENITIDWSARGMVETREPVIAALAEAGCQRLHVGIEHLDDNILTFFRKQDRYHHIEQFCQLCTKYGIQVLGYFILGAPGETRQFRDSLPDRLEALNITMPYFNVLTPLSNTAYYSYLLETGQLKDDFWSGFIQQPTKDFAIQSGRSFDEDLELRETVEKLAQIFQERSRVRTVSG
ncbi:MAG: B12-binding domain-containing radical SAM protein [Magnetococcales bacterium]|nr:B12-binding domain-containing radical SAM protein [Magnetococcales bacterium]